MNHNDSAGFPAPGERLAPSHPSQDTLSLSEPGPDSAQIEQLLGIAARVPDHGKLAPWRFIVFQDEARESFGRILGKLWAARTPDATAEQIAFEANRFTRAPLVIAVISKVTEKHAIPLWEQELSAGAVCQNLLIAASAMGFGAQWLTEWYAFDSHAKDALGLRSGERVAGFIYIGSAENEVVERKRPAAQISHWKR